MKPSIKGALKICTNGHGPLTKMAAMPIYGKTLKNLLLKNEESFETDSCIGDSRSTMFIKMMIVGWPLTFLRQSQICILIYLQGVNVEKSFSQNVLKT